MSTVVPLYGFGGGGASLNFDVKSYATEEEMLAATPKENTIGVVTGSKITGWVFSSTEPAGPLEGMVWFFTSSTSPVEFNALKKNSVQVYPRTAQQYTDGSFVSVPAMTYRSQEWTWWGIYLYDKGETYDDITGGWEFVKGRSGTPGQGTYSDNGTSITLTAGSTNVSKRYKTINTIDLTDVTQICVNVTELDSGHGDICVGPTEYYDDDIAVLQMTETGTHCLDVSSLKGSYYVSVHRHSNSSGGNKGSVTFNQVWMI